VSNKPTSPVDTGASGPNPISDLDRLIADHLDGDVAASEALADLLERDPSVRSQVALHLMLHRALVQAGGSAIDIDHVLRALPRKPSGSIQTSVLRRIAHGEAQRRRRVLIPLASVALLMLTVLALVWWNLARPSSDTRIPQLSQVVSATVPEQRAILRSSPHAQWPLQRAPVDANGRVTAQRIDLCAGLAELELPSGATLVLQGPTLLDLTGSNSARLLLGRLTAYVPTRAHGFTLQAEGVQVVDLGTAFGLGQDAGGIAELHVFAGAVKATARIDGIDTTRQLAADEAVRIDPRGASWATVPCDPSRFVHGLRPRGFTLDLADLVAGGDGFGIAAADGLDPLSATLATGPSTGSQEDPLNGFHATSRGNSIDGTFIPDGGTAENIIDSAGHRFRFPDTDGRSYDIIRRGGTFDTPSYGGRPGHPGIPPVFGGIDYRAPGRTALGMHANVGMTIDLQNVAYRHPGLRVDRLSAVLANVGRSGGARGRADFWVLVDGQLIARYDGITPKSAPIELDIPLVSGQRFLTLVSTDGENGNGLDWITLGDPRLHLSEAR
jgi:hypothetical protein